MIAGFLGQTPSSLGQTIALLLTFLGIGVIVNVLIIYVVAQVLAERKENQERRRRSRTSSPLVWGARVSHRAEIKSVKDAGRQASNQTACR